MRSRVVIDFTILDVLKVPSQLGVDFSLKISKVRGIGKESLLSVL
jgi:hypothetical protein